jgi:hypothetical protein
MLGFGRRKRKRIRKIVDLTRIGRIEDRSPGRRADGDSEGFDVVSHYGVGPSALVDVYWRTVDKIATMRLAAIVLVCGATVVVPLLVTIGICHAAGVHIRPALVAFGGVLITFAAVDGLLIFGVRKTRAAQIKAANQAHKNRDTGQQFVGKVSTSQATQRPADVRTKKSTRNKHTTRRRR